MTNALQDLITKTPNGVPGTPNYIDLGNKTYTIGGDQTQQFPFAIGDVSHDLVLTGSGAQIVVLDAPESLHRNGVMLRGTRVRLEGDVTVVGPRPDNSPWYEPREFESGIAVEGAINCFVGWKVRNVWGSSVSVRRRRKSGQPDRRTKNITLDFESRQTGRQHVNIDDADHADVSFQGTDCVRAALDVEIPGSNGIVNDLYYHDTDLYGHWNGMALANLGAGQTVGGCRNFHVQRVQCHGSPFGVRCVPPDGVRRTNYLIEDCGSDSVANLSTLTFWRVDGVTVRRIVQPMTPGVKLARFNDCTGIACDVPYVSG